MQTARGSTSARLLTDKVEVPGAPSGVATVAIGDDRAVTNALHGRANASKPIADAASILAMGGFRLGKKENRIKKQKCKSNNIN